MSLKAPRELPGGGATLQVYGAVKLQEVLLMRFQGVTWSRFKVVNQGG
jgi:hypothetical protein